MRDRRISNIEAALPFSSGFSKFPSCVIPPLLLLLLLLPHHLCDTLPPGHAQFLTYTHARRASPYSGRPRYSQHARGRLRNVNNGESSAEWPTRSMRRGTIVRLLGRGFFPAFQRRFAAAAAIVLRRPGSATPPGVNRTMQSFKVKHNTAITRARARARIRTHTRYVRPIKAAALHTNAIFSPRSGPAKLLNCPRKKVHGSVVHFYAFIQLRVVPVPSSRPPTPPRSSLRAGCRVSSARPRLFRSRFLAKFRRRASSRRLPACERHC